mgnify:CR=1 FL=1
MKVKPDLGFWKLWNLSFGFFGVQIAYALQSANVSRIFATLGADPHDLSYFWILPPLMGLLVQPVVGTLSDRTWTRFGRRLPYLIVGAVVAAAVMCLLPNAGSFHLAVSSAIMLGLVALMMLDTSINMAMQPFKMLVGDMVNEKQKGMAYSIQSFLCNSGSIVGFVFPFVLTMVGIQNTAEAGVIPPAVVYSFYAGALVLLLCVVYSLVKIKEWPPHVYAEYNGVTTETKNGETKEKRTNLITLLVKAPKTFWTVGLVQFFCWIAFLFMWTYTNGTVARNAFECPTTEYVTGFRMTDSTGSLLSYSAKHVLTADSTEVINDGKLLMPFEELPKNSELLLAGMMGEDPQTHKLYLEGVKHVNVEDPAGVSIEKHVVLNTDSDEYNAAGNWVGILFAVQAIGAVLWAIVLPRFRSRKFSYVLSLLLGAVGFVSAGLFTNQYLLFLSFLLIGCPWAAMLAWPFTILTNSLKGGNIGAYLGLFNCTICIPQIIGAIAGGWILSALGNGQDLAPQWGMMIVAGVSLVFGALCVSFIKETSGETTASISEKVAE